MIRLDSAAHAPLRELGTDEQEARTASEFMPFLLRHTHETGLYRIMRLPRWMIRGYQRYQAADLAAIIAYHAMIAMVPIFFLLVGVGGLFLRNDQVLDAAFTLLQRLFPSESGSVDAFQAALDVRQNSTLVSLLSFIAFGWVGTGLISSIARSMNKLYGVRNASYIVEKQRGFGVILLFLLFFLAAILASIVPTLLLLLKLPAEIEAFFQTSLFNAVVAYGIALVSTLLLFFVLYRIVPNARLTVIDVWPGTLIASILFLAMTQIFPLYIQMVGGIDRYGRLLGLISLIVAGLYFLAHIILFGCFVNVTWRHDRYRRARVRRIKQLQAEGRPITQDVFLDEHDLDVGNETR